MTETRDRVKWILVPASLIAGLVAGGDWLVASWALASVLVALGLAGALIPRLDRIYVPSVLLLAFLLGHMAGMWITVHPILEGVIDRPDVTAWGVSLSRLILVLVGMIMAGRAGRLRKVGVGRPPLLWFLAVPLVFLAMNYWYGKVFFPRLGIFSYGWFLETDPAWLVVVWASVSSLLRAALDEITFRGWILEGLEDYRGEVALWSQALLFGGIHYHPILQPYGVTGFLLMTAVGLALGWLRIRTGGIALGVCLLAALNLAVFWV